MLLVSFFLWLLLKIVRNDTSVMSTRTTINDNSIMRFHYDGFGCVYVFFCSACVLIRVLGFFSLVFCYIFKGLGLVLFGSDFRNLPSSVLRHHAIKPELP